MIFLVALCVRARANNQSHGSSENTVYSDVSDALLQNVQKLADLLLALVLAVHHYLQFLAFVDRGFEVQTVAHATQLPSSDESDFVTQCVGLLHKMGREQHCLVGRHSLNQLPKVSPLHWVSSRAWLIEENDLRFPGQRHRHGAAPAHAS